MAFLSCLRWAFFGSEKKEPKTKMTTIILSTGNIVAGGPSIIRKSGEHRSNLELTNSLKSSFVAAQEDYSAALVNGNGHVIVPNGTHSPGLKVDRPVPEIWTERDGANLYIPRIDWSVAGLEEDRPQYEITLKLFFLPTASVEERPKYIDAALELVKKELGVDKVDLLIVSFPGISFEGDCEWEADKLNSTMGNEDDEIYTWGHLEQLHQNGRIERLGIAEFGTDKLAKFISKVKVRPVVDQINTRNCCSVPPPLTKLAKEEGIELLTHSDCTDILPSGTLRELLGQGPEGAGVLADQSGSYGLKGDLTPQWVVKYTAFVKDRGVIENKGYFASAALVEKS